MVNDPNGGLHLTSLSIRGFRGIRELDIPRLGRVTLLAGKNGVGKTAVTEAVQLYASRGHESVWSEIATRHEEFAPTVDDDGDLSLDPNPAALLHSRKVSTNSCMEIGPRGSENDRRLTIKIVPLSEEEAEFLEMQRPDAASGVTPLAMEVAFGNHRKTMPLSLSHCFGPGNNKRSRFYRRFFDDRRNFPSGQACRSLGPGLPNDAEVADLWDGIALTEDEKHAIRALNLVIDGEAERATTIGETLRRRRQIVVKLRGRDRRAPLRSLGDGATRLFGAALTLAGSRDGFMVIDEAENGIHHSVHDAFWRMVLQTAEENNVQVFATTHSFDCVRGFARAAKDSPESEGVLVRLEKAGERTRAVMYSAEDLETAADQHIEVR